MSFLTHSDWLIAGAWALCAGGAAWCLLTLAGQITYVTLADGRQLARSLPLLLRATLPLTPNVRKLFLGPAFAKAREDRRRKLLSSGYDGLVSPEDLLALKLILPLAAGTLWVLFVRTAAAAAPGSPLPRLETALQVMGLAWFFIYPDLWLKRAVQARHSSIRRALPFVLDLLTLSVEAGLDFMSALQRNLVRRPMDALGEELLRVIREIQLGRTRAQALADMAGRVQLPDLRAVVNALIQADELGVSIGSILRIQSDQMRQRRFERAERLANEAPVKMLFPLLLFIFPATFLILLGPILLRLMQQAF
jgi:tight adherence protein C